MNAPSSIGFDSRAGFQQRLRELMRRSFVTLDLFDPDLALFQLGASDVDAELRRFLHAGGFLRLAMHSSAHLARHAPRFPRLLRDYSHRIECRLTPRSLRQLTDSFAIGDGMHVVRRFHSAHLRGEAAFDAPQEIELPRARFLALWQDAEPGLQPTITGL
ncbi:hypothetical protein [Massilia sp. 9096]|uniref:DUF7931 domain-containing protein n=1 Tax=Massilia sp. 9096 TaxID=1500894 RepID=UPI0005657CC8|nr:hypothetical protein [Massilia sp. 9096]